MFAVPAHRFNTNTKRPNAAEQPRTTQRSSYAAMEANRFARTHSKRPDAAEQPRTSQRSSYAMQAQRFNTPTKRPDIAKQPRTTLRSTYAMEPQRFTTTKKRPDATKQPKPTIKSAYSRKAQELTSNTNRPHTAEPSKTEETPANSTQASKFNSTTKRPYTAGTSMPTPEISMQAPELTSTTTRPDTAESNTSLSPVSSIVDINDDNGSILASTETPPNQRSTTQIPTTSTRQPKSQAKSIYGKRPEALYKNISPKIDSRRGIDKVTLERRFINERKRLHEYIEDLDKKQKPVLRIYRQIVEIQKQLEAFGKLVYVEEVKLIPLRTIDEGTARRNQITDVVTVMKDALREALKSFVSMYKTVIMDWSECVLLLKNSITSNVDTPQTNEQMEYLMLKDAELKQSLEASYDQQISKITGLFHQWEEILYSSGKNADEYTPKIEKLLSNIIELENKLRESNEVNIKLREQLKEQKMDSKRLDKKYNGLLKESEEKHKLTEQALATEQEECKQYKLKNSTKIHTIQSLKKKLGESEAETKKVEEQKSALNKQITNMEKKRMMAEGNWKNQMANFEVTIENQKTEYKKLTYKYENYCCQRCKELEKQRKRLNGEIQTLTKTVASLTHQLKKRDTNNMTRHTQVTDEEWTTEREKNKLERTEYRLERARDRVTELTEASHEMKEEIKFLKKQDQYDRERYLNQVVKEKLPEFVKTSYMASEKKMDALKNTNERQEMEIRHLLESAKEREDELKTYKWDQSSLIDYCIDTRKKLGESTKRRTVKGVSSYIRLK